MNPRAFQYLKKGQKYKNKSCSVDGIPFDSRKEAAHYGVLRMEKLAGQIKGFRRQVTYELKVNGERICGHRVDFVVERLDGTEEVHEVKGFATPEWKLKKKLFEACFPEIPYIVI